MAIEFITDDELPESTDSESTPFIPVAWFTDEFKAAIQENPGKWGTMNDGKVADKSYFEKKLRRQAVEVSEELGGKVVLHFERVPKEPEERKVEKEGSPNFGKTVKVYFYQGKVRAKFVEDESYPEGTELAEVAEKRGK